MPQAVHAWATTAQITVATAAEGARRSAPTAAPLTVNRIARSDELSPTTISYAMTASCRTVTGTIAAEELGVVLTHEHLIFDVSVHSGRADNRCDDRELISAELQRFAQAGGGAICDVTPEGLGRDPAALREISAATGVPIVSGIGLYTRDVFPPELRSAGREPLAEYLRRRVDETSAGILGEVASKNAERPDWRGYQMADHEVALFQASADAQRSTGLAITTHASLGRAGVAQLRVLEAAGASLERVVTGHCDAHVHEDAETDHEYYDQLLAFGAVLEFDLFGWEELGPDRIRLQRIAELCERGRHEQILVSTDTCRLSQLHANGGRGFTFLFDSILPGLRAAGVDDAAIHAITVANPRRLLSAAG